MNNFRWGYREAQSARPAPLRAPVVANRQMSTASRICLLIAFVLSTGVIVVGCMAGVGS